MTKAVQISIERDRYHFIVRVYADGILQASETAHIGTVVRVRNKLAQHWSNHPDGPSVTAAAIPWPAEYNPDRRGDE